MQFPGNIAREAFPDPARRHAAHNGVRRHIACHHGAGGQHRAITHRDTGQNSHAMADPNIISNLHTRSAAFGEKCSIALLGRFVVFRHIGKAMLRRAAHGVIGGAYSDASGNGAEFANFCIRHLAVMPKIGSIAKRRVFHRRSFQDFTARAYGGFTQLHAWVDEGLGDFGLGLCHAGASHQCIFGPMAFTGHAVNQCWLHFQSHQVGPLGVKMLDCARQNAAKRRRGQSAGSRACLRCGLILDLSQYAQMRAVHHAGAERHSGRMTIGAPRKAAEPWGLHG